MQQKEFSQDSVFIGWPKFSKKTLNTSVFHINLMDFIFVHQFYVLYIFNVLKSGRSVNRAKTEIDIYMYLVHRLKLN